MVFYSVYCIDVNGQNIPKLQIGPLKFQTNKKDIKSSVMPDDIKVQSAIQKTIYKAKSAY